MLAIKRLLAMVKRKGNKKGAPRGDSVRRDPWDPVFKGNQHLERLYNELDLIPEDEKATFWETMRRDLPNSFRFTGSRGHALAVQERLKDFYIPQITSIKHEDEPVEPPRPVPWYPDQLAWSMATSKRVLRRFPPFASFKKFLIAETGVGNISRQEVVSMIPPLLMGIKPGMTVLDMCAAPGSKSAQLMELIHAGEEDAMRQVAQDAKSGVAGPEPIGPEGLNDDGRATGLLVANDSDYKRAHMLIHQMKRLNSPNLIVTNHDATLYPSIRLPQPPDAAANAPKRYLKFDRILADVPCTGDGTPRKNFLLWKDWSPASPLNLHAIQIRILVRALQMLKVGGRVVYSTCSMNPVEDEAVIASAIDRCGGSDYVRIVDCGNELPGLKRSAGVRSWKVMDREGRFWDSWAQVQEHREREGPDGLAKVSETMFPTSEDLPLERCVRIFPHQQDTGGFFITVLEKQSEIRPKQENPSKAVPKSSVAALSEELDSKKKNGSGESLSKIDALDDLVVPNPDAQEKADKSASVAEASHGVSYSATFDPSSQTPMKRDADNLDDEHAAKRTKVEDGTDAVIGDRPVHPPAPAAQDPAHFETSDNTSTPAPPAQQEPQRPAKRKPGQPSEEPFKYLAPDNGELASIFNFYEASERFPRDRFMVRNAQAQPIRTIYYTSALARDVLTSNESLGIKFVHCGVKMFVKQDARDENACKWRTQAEGLSLLEPWLGAARSITLTHKGTLRKLLAEMFPRINDDGWKELGEIGERVRDIPMGCSILRVEPNNAEDGFSERMVFPLWRSMYSLNLMLPKEERHAMLLRLYNIDAMPANTTQKRQGPVAALSPDTPADDSSGKIALAEAEEGSLKQENEDMGQDQQDQTDTRETWTKDGDEEDRFNTTV